MKMGQASRAESGVKVAAQLHKQETAATLLQWEQLEAGSQHEHWLHTLW